MLTCRACGVEPYTYLRHVLAELPHRADAAELSDLLPFIETSSSRPNPSSPRLPPCP
nr:transposase domain-containing protein [Noviherbaspirillum sedimenti]